MLDRSHAERLKAVFAGAHSVDAGQLQFINLDDVQKHSGPRWPVIRKRVFDASENFIEKRLGNAGVVIRAATGFLILCPPDSDSGTDERIRQISEELLAFYLGDEFLSKLHLGVSTRRVTLEEVSAVMAGAHAPERAEAPPAEAARPAQQPGYAAETGYEIVFKPVWAVSAESVAIYCALAVRQRRDGVIVRGHDLLPHPVRPEDSLVLDLDALHRARDGLNALLADGGRCAVAVPVHFETLAAGRTRIVFLRELSSLPPLIRQFVLVRIEGAPSDAPRSRLEEVCRVVKPHCARVFLHTPTDADRLARFDGAGVDAFGVTAPKSLAAFKARENDFDRFMMAAERLHARVYMDGCDDIQVVEAAIIHGVTYFAGQAIGAGQRELSLPFRLTWTEIVDAADRHGDAVPVQARA